MKAKTTTKAKKSAMKQMDKLAAKNKITDKTTFTLFIFPNQLLSKKHMTKLLNTKNLANKVTEIVFIDHPLYYGYHSNINKPVTNLTKAKYNFNKIKCAYHYACNKYYQTTVLPTLLNNCSSSSSNKNTKIKTKIINLDDWQSWENIGIKNNYQHQLIFLDTLNKELNHEIEKRFKQFVKLDNPVILTGSNSLKKYYDSHKNKRQSHSAFYKWQREKLNILTSETKAYDIQQKMPLSEHKNVPDINVNLKKIITSIDQKYINEGIAKFEDNITLEGAEILFPITHKGADLVFRNFLKSKLMKFGQYQDSIVPGNDKKTMLLYHAGISPMLNVGLLLPEDVISETSKYWKVNKKRIDKGAYEAFIRQIIGWREYQYYIYLYFSEKIEKLNFFNNGNKLTASLYQGTTGIEPVDDAIKTAFKYGYLHHILRLMIIANFMNLTMIKPCEVFKWFMEFSLDSYEWVMYCNVYSMGLWSDGGIAMRKPYIASSNYIAKMSNYKLPKEKGDVVGWAALWNAIFYYFISQNKEAVAKTYYKGMITNWNKKSSEEKARMTKLASEFIKNKFVLN